ncbi:MAG: U32 family peptidase C-terminal domain-containing protein, partial [FCB group bacterium]|nr:U32 family peptidase C-terminal domain-containing protein [FCB group bacterium]
EGRTKSEYYAGMSARSYRKAIDDMVEGREFNQQNLKDLLALSNRSYTTGFYTRNPREYGENYHDSRSKELTHKAVGMNLCYEKEEGLLSFELKNRLEKDTEIEIISPSGTQFHQVAELINAKGNSVEVAHGGTGRCAIPWQSDPGEFAIIRRRLYPQELATVLD